MKPVSFVSFSMWIIKMTTPYWENINSHYKNYERDQSHCRCTSGSLIYIYIYIALRILGVISFIRMFNIYLFFEVLLYLVGLYRDLSMLHFGMHVEYYFVQRSGPAVQRHYLGRGVIFALKFGCHFL